MLAAILGFLTALFNNGGNLIRQIAALFRENPEQAKQRVENENEKETREREQGGRPKWN